jgi:hypothetical protein
VAEANRQLGQQPTPPASVWGAAQIFALCAGTTVRLDTPTSTERNRRVEEYATRAVELLEQYRSTGGLNNPAKLEQLKQLKNFEAIRQRPEFQKFLQALER